MSFENKVVLVTGAGSGIGEAIALRFATLSVRLALLDINLESLTKVVEKCESLSGTEVIQIAIDVTKDEDVKDAVDKTIEVFGKIDVLVNCAGIVYRGGLLGSDFIKSFDKVLNINLRSYVVLTHYAAAALVESKGCIINIASVCGTIVDKNCIAYSASKAAVIHFTRNAALELADKGVRVNSISPGIVKTNLYTNSGVNVELPSGSQRRKPPLKHILQTEEIAELAAYLASDKAKSITGADFVIDSGSTLLGSLNEYKNNYLIKNSHNMYFFYYSC